MVELEIACCAQMPVNMQLYQELMSYAVLSATQQTRPSEALRSATWHVGETRERWHVGQEELDGQVR